VQFGASVLPSNCASTDAAGSLSECNENAAEVGRESPQTGHDVVLELQRKIELLETQLAVCQEKLNEAEKENAVLLEHQFSMDKIKHDNAAVYFQGCHYGPGAGDFHRLLQVWALATLIQNENIGKRKMHQIQNHALKNKPIVY